MSETVEQKPQTPLERLRAMQAETKKLEDEVMAGQPALLDALRETCKYGGLLSREKLEGIVAKRASGPRGPRKKKPAPEAPAPAPEPKASEKKKH